MSLLSVLFGAGESHLIMTFLSTFPGACTRRACHGVFAVAAVTTLFAGRAVAQGNTAGAGDTSGAAIQIEPHHLIFNAGSKTATMKITNPGSKPQSVDVFPEFGYADWPHGAADTMLIATNMDAIDAHDTVVMNPGPKEPYAGRWLSGFPTHFTLAPHETKNFTLRIAPPASTPAGVYWARLVARIQPNDPNHGHNIDVQKKYAMPAKGRTHLLQDTCSVYFQTGQVHSGLTFGPTAKAVIDSANIGGAGTQNFSHALWVRLPVKVNGNAPFIGQMHSTYQNLTTGEVVKPDTKEYSVFKDGVMHWVIETDVLAPGKYTLTIDFDKTRTDSTSEPVIPTTPAKVVFPFEVKPAWAY